MNLKKILHSKEVSRVSFAILLMALFLLIKEFPVLGH
jgi:hypothetical protein